MSCTHLDFLVLFGQFSAEFLQLVLHGRRLAQLRSSLILLFLQLVRPFLALRVISIKLLHICQQLGVFLLKSFELRQWGFDSIQKLVEISRGFLDFTF